MSYFYECVFQAKLFIESEKFISSKANEAEWWIILIAAWGALTFIATVAAIMYWVSKEFHLQI